MPEELEGQGFGFVSAKAHPRQPYDRDGIMAGGEAARRQTIFTEPRGPMD
jgi:hypothetical protein